MTSKLHVYVLYQCANLDSHQMGNIEGIYLTKKGAEARRIKLGGKRGVFGDRYYAILRKTVRGNIQGFNKLDISEDKYDNRMFLL